MRFPWTPKRFASTATPPARSKSPPPSPAPSMTPTSLSVPCDNAMKWNLGFPAYLVADGEYPVLSRGQEIDSFALEFHPRTLRSAQAAAKQATLSIGCDY